MDGSQDYLVKALYFTQRETEVQNREGLTEAMEPASERSGLKCGHASIDV